MRRWYAETSHGCAGTSATKHLAAQPCKYSPSSNRQYFPRRNPGIRFTPLDRVRSYTQDTGTRSNSATSATLRSWGLEFTEIAFLLSLGLPVVDAIFG